MNNIKDKQLCFGTTSRETEEESVILCAEDKESKKDQSKKEECSNQSEDHLKGWQTCIGKSKRSVPISKSGNGNNNKFECINIHSEFRTDEEYEDKDGYNMKHRIIYDH